MRATWQAKAFLLALLAIVALIGSGAGQATSTAAPANTVPPTITGVPTVGQTLTAGNGTWTNSPTGFGYQWKRCDAAGACQDIAG